MHIGLQAGFNGDLLGADLLEQIAFHGFEVVRAEAGSNPHDVTAEILDALLMPLIICRTIQQVETLPPDVMVEIGNEPDLAHFLERDFEGSVEHWRAVSMAAVEQHLETGRMVYLGAVSNLNTRGFSFLRHLDWNAIPRTVGCSFHRYPEAGSYTAGHDGRSRDAEYDELIKIVGHRPLALTETGYSTATWSPRSHQVDALAYERAFWELRPEVQFAIAYQLNDGPSGAEIDGYGFRDVTGQWKTELVEAWVGVPDVPEPIPAPGPVTRIYQVPIDFADEGFTLKGTLVATVTVIMSVPEPEPVPVPRPPEPEPDLIPMDDGALLDIANEFRARGKLEDLGGLVDAGSHYGRRIQAGYPREQALADVRDLVMQWYGPV
jgi:hypothetical protein